MLWEIACSFIGPSLAFSLPGFLSVQFSYRIQITHLCYSVFELKAKKKKSISWFDFIVIHLYIRLAILTEAAVGSLKLQAVCITEWHARSCSIRGRNDFSLLIYRDSIISEASVSTHCEAVLYKWYTSFLWMVLFLPFTHMYSKKKISSNGNH